MSFIYKPPGQVSMDFCAVHKNARAGLGARPNGNGPGVRKGPPGRHLHQDGRRADQAASGLANFSTRAFMRAVSGANASLATFTDSSWSLVASETIESKLCLA